jgi:hypothetical protein
MKRHTSQEWINYFGFEVIDADGWRSRGETTNDPAELTVVEFTDRLNESTISFSSNPYDRERRKVLDYIS